MDLENFDLGGNYLEGCNEGKIGRFKDHFVEQEGSKIRPQNVHMVEGFNIVM